MRDSFQNSAEEFAQCQLESGTPAVHVLHDFSLRMDNLEPDPDKSEVSREVGEAGLASGQSANLATFDSLEGNEDYSHCNNNDQGNVHSFEKIDSIRAVYHITSFINAPLNF